MFWMYVVLLVIIFGLTSSLWTAAAGDMSISWLTGGWSGCVVLLICWRLLLHLLCTLVLVCYLCSISNFFLCYCSFYVVFLVGKLISRRPVSHALTFSLSFSWMATKLLGLESLNMSHIKSFSGIKALVHAVSLQFPSFRKKICVNVAQTESTGMKVDSLRKALFLISMGISMKFCIIVYIPLERWFKMTLPVRWIPIAKSFIRK